MGFAAVTIERCKRREISVEEAMIGIYAVGISARRVEGVSEILWGAGALAATVST